MRPDRASFGTALTGPGARVRVGVKHMREVILAVDCGSSAFKSAFLTREESLISGPRVEVAPIPRSGADLQEWGPREAIGDLAKCLFLAASEAMRSDLKICGLAVTTTTSTLVCVDTKQRMALIAPPPLRWDDLRSASAAELVEKCRRQTKSFPWIAPVRADSGIAKLVHFLRTYPDAWSGDAPCVMEQWTYYTWWLTGTIAHSETILARKWGRTQNQPWKRAFLGSLVDELRQTGCALSREQLKEVFSRVTEPSICATGDRIGTLRNVVSEVTGLPAGIGVYAAPFDTCAQIMGCGIVEGPGQIGISLGTSLGVCLLTATNRRWGPFGPIPDTPIRGTAMLFDGVASCGSAINYVAARFGAWSHGKLDRRRVALALAQTVPGSDGVTMLPYFAGGRRASIAQSVPGRIEGLNVRVGNEQIIRSLFESLAYMVRVILEDMEALQDCRRSVPRAGGGPATNKDFCQMLADVLARPLEVSTFVDTALVGAALSAARGLGWFNDFETEARVVASNYRKIEPDPARAEVYDQYYREYVRQYGEALGR